MATTKKTAEVDYSMYEKIMALYELQKIDSQIDEINKVKGELPDEVQDLDDEIAVLVEVDLEVVFACSWSSYFDLVFCVVLLDIDCRGGEFHLFQ